MRIEINGKCQTELHLIADSQTDWQEMIVSGRSYTNQINELRKYECEHAFLMVIKLLNIERKNEVNKFPDHRF